jgi:glutamate-1-semialdehyde 2,1-aminomutase
MGVIPPQPGFLKTLRAVTKKSGSLLIFDEVMTGFRVSLGGAQGLFGVRPDLTCLGKVIGGGMPLAAFGGPKEMMDYLFPLGPVYQAGTLSGNPAAVACGIATLKLLKKQPELFRRAETRALELEKGVQKLIRQKKLAWTFQRSGTMWTLFFSSRPVRNFLDARKSDTRLFGKFFRFLLSKNIFIAPSAFEANFLSSAHLRSHVEETLKAIANFAGGH